MRAEKIGWGLSAIVAILLFADAAIGLAMPARLVGAMAKTGFTAAQLPLISAIAIVATLLFLVPRTALPGAILLSGFLGGAICTHVRIGEIGSPPEIACLLLGALAWAGLGLRDAGIGARLWGRR